MCGVSGEGFASHFVYAFVCVSVCCAYANNVVWRVVVVVVEEEFNMRFYFP